MPAAPRRLTHIATAGALAISASGALYAGTAAPARAAGYNGYCTGSSGVTVVVDFRSLGGGIAVRCASVSSGATGLDALQAAGVPVTMAARQPGFVCRLYGKPASDPCVNASPADAYWSYWHAPNGGSWTYSNEGAGTHQVITGGFEGWAFSTGAKVAPGVAPTRPVDSPKPTPQPKPTTTHTTTQPPAPTRHTTTTPPPHTTTTTAAGTTTTGERHPSPSSRSSAGHATHPSSTATSTARGSHTTHPSASSAATRSHRNSTSAAAGPASGGPTSGGDAAAAGGPTLADSDRLIKDSDRSSGINATTVVGGGVLAVLAIGGAAVAVVRRHNL